MRLIEKERYLNRLLEALAGDQTLPAGFQEELAAIFEEIIHSTPMDSIAELLHGNSEMATKIAALLALARRRYSDLNRETDNLYYRLKSQLRESLVAGGGKLTEAKLEEASRADPVYQNLKAKRDQSESTATCVEQFAFILRDRQRSLAEMSINRRHQHMADDESA